MKLPIILPSNIKKRDYVIVLGAGPSLDQEIERAIQWQKDHNALVVAAHYRFKLKADYTVFTTPQKFRVAQGVTPGKYIVGPRITDNQIRRKYWRKTFRIKYAKTTFTKWKSDSFVTSDFSIPNGGCGFEATVISTFCEPKYMMLLGFDGYEKVGNDVVVKHSKTSAIKAIPKRRFERLPVSKRNRIMDAEIQRRKSLEKLFKYLTQNLKIDVTIFEKDRFRSINKSMLASEYGVHVL